LMELAKMYPNYIRDVNDFKCEKEVGTGGFGTVWLGVDLKTNAKVAVKELLSRNLHGTVMKQYIREVHTLLVANDHPIIVPLIGFTIEPPFTIITKYIPNDSLKHWFYKSEHPPQLSGTHKSMILMLLASAMVHLSEKHVIHRDIKCGNVLMDEKQKPKLIDFGIARMESDSNNMTRRIGTTQFMAPELMKDKHYTSKVDVYAFGMLIFEMCEGKLPFTEVPRETLYETVPQGTAQLICSKSMPPSMKKLIIQCIQVDPDDRPTFQEIYNMVVSGKATFPGCENRKVKDAHETLQKELAKRRNRVKEPPKLYVDVNKELAKLEKLMRTQVDEDDDVGEEFGIRDDNEFDLDTSILNNPNHFDYMQYVKQVTNKIKPESLGILAGTFSECFKASTTKEVISFIFDIINKINTNESTFLTTCLEAGILKNLPVNVSPDIDQTIINLLINVADTQSKYIDESCLQGLEFLIKQYPDKMLKFIAPYIINLPPKETSYPVLQKFLDMHQIFLESPVSYKFIKFCSFLNTKVPDFCTYAATDLLKILTNGTVHNDPQTANGSVLALTNMYDPSIHTLDFEILLNSASNKFIQHELLSLFIRIQKFPASRRFVSTLIDLAKTSVKGFYTLMNFAQCGPENAQLLVTNTQWMTSGLPQMCQTFSLYVYLFTNPENRILLVDSPNFVEFYKLLIQSRDMYVYLYLPTVIQFSKLNAEKVSLLDEAEVFKNFYGLIVQANDERILSGGVILSDTLARIKYVESVQTFIPIMKRMLSFYPRQSGQIISTLVTLSSVKEYAQILNTNFGDYFKSLLGYEQYKVYGEYFLKNVSKFLENKE